ncbi:hypothetical protein AVEN_57511-1 [Araneus ventricosus]|uniref:Uncharacterized protein n=1 Tax=Araneus ventricosus TaxID=182803 RepID=A0A4Y2WGI5_ARAVE|nr:hypothetical protein AVEN_57511-1 [Araneus ventricosus]
MYGGFSVESGPEAETLPLNHPGFADLILQVRWRFVENDELHSNTSESELQIPLCWPKTREDLDRRERFVNVSSGAKNQRNLGISCSRAVRESLGSQMLHDST